MTARFTLGELVVITHTLRPVAMRVDKILAKQERPVQYFLVSATTYGGHLDGWYNEDRVYPSKLEAQEGEFRRVRDEFIQNCRTIEKNFAPAPGLEVGK